MNIVLIGMRGAGKTTIGKNVADALRITCIQTDDIVEDRQQKKIAELVAEHGWEYFRDREEEAVREATKKDNVVIATGGGVVLRTENIRILKKNGKIIYLRAKIETLARRIGKDTKRPLLTQAKNIVEDLENVFSIRRKRYEKAADVIIDTDYLTEDEVVNVILHNTKYYEK